MFAPELGVVGKEFAQRGLDLAGVGGERTNLVALEKLDVSLFLARDNVVDEHGAFGRDGFMNGRSAGLSDHQVMGGQEFGDFAGPAFDLHPAGELVFDFPGLFIKAAKVPSEDDGDLGVVL